MKNYTEFDLLAIKHGLDLNRNQFNYLDPKTVLARIFWDAQQSKIDELENFIKEVNHE